MDKENPFDSGWSILKSLKAEIRDLRSTLRAEIQMRETEVSDLTREVKTIKDELAKERADRRAETQKQIEPINSLTVSLKDEVRKMKAQRDREIQTLNDGLDDEKKDRQLNFKKLEDQLAFDEQARTTVMNDVKHGLLESRRFMELSCKDSRQSIHCLVMDVKTIGDHLNRVNLACQGFSLDALQSQQRPPGPQTAQSARSPEIVGMTSTTQSLMKSTTPGGWNT